MKDALTTFWERVRSHILYIPGLLALFGVLLAIGMVELDRRLDAETIREIPWFFRAGASGAREVLSTVAVAVVQMAAITFSVTIVALALRSQQFGPRLLRNYTSDQVNQVILGTLIGTFAYALLVLRAVRDVEDAAIDEETFIPFVAVTLAILLALLSLALFVVFIDRVVGSIQANSIIAEAANEVHAAVDELFPEPLGREEGDEPADEDVALSDPVPVLAGKTGYIQAVRPERLIQLARSADVVLRMEAPIGGFVVKGTPLAQLAPAGRVDAKLLNEVRRAYTIGRDRSTAHDPEFGVRQIVDVAVKALSPSDNDPTTAVTATEYLGALLIDFATRRIPSRLRRDETGVLRVVAVGATFHGMVDLAFDQLREYGAHHVALTLVLLETIGRIAPVLRSESRRGVLAEHVWKVSRAAKEKIDDPVDREAVNQRLARAMRALGRGEADMIHYLLPPQKQADGSSS